MLADGRGALGRARCTSLSAVNENLGLLYKVSVLYSVSATIVGAALSKHQREDKELMAGAGTFFGSADANRQC